MKEATFVEIMKLVLSSLIQMMISSVIFIQTGEYYDLINDDLVQCISDMHQIIQSAKYKAERNKEFIDNIRNELKDLSKGEN